MLPHSCTKKHNKLREMANGGRWRRCGCDTSISEAYIDPYNPRAPGEVEVLRDHESCATSWVGNWHKWWHRKWSGRGDGDEALSSAKMGSSSRTACVLPLTTTVGIVYFNMPTVVVSGTTTTVRNYNGAEAPPFNELDLLVTTRTITSSVPEQVQEVQKYVTWQAPADVDVDEDDDDDPKMVRDSVVEEDEAAAVEQDTSTAARLAQMKRYVRFFVEEKVEFSLLKSIVLTSLASVGLYYLCAKFFAHQSKSASKKACRCPFCEQEKYQILRRIGKGGYGSVFLVRQMDRAATSLASESSPRGEQESRGRGGGGSTPRPRGGKNGDFGWTFAGGRNGNNIYTSGTTSSGPNYPKNVVAKRAFVETVEEVQQMEQETKILQTLHHPNVVRYIEDFLCTSSSSKTSTGLGMNSPAAARRAEHLQDLPLSSLPRHEAEQDDFIRSDEYISDSPTSTVYHLDHSHSHYSYFIVMEWCDGGDLRNEVEFYHHLLTESQVFDWLLQLSSALKYVHEQGVIHRDVKGQNVFLVSAGGGLTRETTRILKLGDFGLARRRGAARTTRVASRHAAMLMHQQGRGGFASENLSHVGTDCYKAPEMLASSHYGREVDVWGIGCVLFELLTGDFLWDIPEKADNTPRPQGEHMMLSCSTSSDSPAARRLVPSMIRGVDETTGKHSTTTSTKQIKNGLHLKQKQLVHVAASQTKKAASPLSAAPDRQEEQQGQARLQHSAAVDVHAEVDQRAEDEETLIHLGVHVHGDPTIVSKLLQRYTNTGDGHWDRCFALHWVKLLKKLLCKNPAQRPSCEQLYKQVVSWGRNKARKVPFNTTYYGVGGGPLLSGGVERERPAGGNCKKGAAAGQQARGGAGGETLHHIVDGRGERELSEPDDGGLGIQWHAPRPDRTPQSDDDGEWREAFKLKKTSKTGGRRRNNKKNIEEQR